MEFRDFHCTNCQKIFTELAIETTAGMLFTYCPICGQIAHLYAVTKPILEKPTNQWTGQDIAVLTVAGLFTVGLIAGLAKGR